MGVKVIEHRDNGIDFIEITSKDIKAVVSNLGCHLTSVICKDKNGQEGDVVLGYEDLEDCHNDGNQIGSIVGRVANRIAGGKFTLNGQEYQVTQNTGKHHIHGGKVGFDQKIFDYEMIKNGVKFHLLSPDGDEGYPGNLDVIVIYEVVDNEIRLHMEATTDKDTLVNLTNHSYFNLSGKSSKIYDHELQISADKVACMDDECMVTGEFLDVTNTPFDFREPKAIGKDIDDPHPLLALGHGYDHAFILKGEDEQIHLVDPESGRALSICTTMPTCQVYTANFLSGVNGKNGQPYDDRDAVAIETEFLPNEINVSKNPQVILRKGEKFETETVYRFHTV